ncbi:response regulator receiver protein [Sulfobacillus acidophilus TPY]|nr:response regulator receiver protein [Sulfobacillus acidophilus TPY]
MYLTSREEKLGTLLSAIKNVPGAVLLGSATNLRQGLKECAQDHPGVHLIDDGLLEHEVGLWEQMATLPYPAVVIGEAVDAGAARRALAIQAKDIIPWSSLSTDLAAVLTRVATSLEGKIRQNGRVIVVFSSKGGVGKTTLSVNLGVALAKASRQPVALVDLDVQFGDVAAMVGDAPLVTIYDLVRGTHQVDAELVKRALKRVTNNVYLLAAPNNPEEAEEIQADHVVQILQLLRENHAYVVVDTAPGYNDINVAAFDFADVILTVCTPDVVTLRTIGQALRVFLEGFHYEPSKVRLVLNRSGSKTGVENLDITRVLDYPVRYELPSDGAYPARAANEGEPLTVRYPESLLSRAIQQLAIDLVQEVEGRKRTTEKSLKTRTWRNWLRRGDKAEGTR